MNDEPAILALVGLRCAGKTSVGRELARRLKIPFVDLDDEITSAFAQAQGVATEAVRGATTGASPRPVANATGAALSAGEILARIGEPAFRDLEERALEAVLARGTTYVLATGGGVVERAVNRELLARCTRCFWLRVGIPELQRRLRADAVARPPLLGPDSNDPAAELEELSRRREPLYAEVAGLTLDGRGKRVGELAGEILARLGRGSGRGCRA